MIEHQMQEVLAKLLIPILFVFFSLRQLLYFQMHLKKK